MSWTPHKAAEREEVVALARKVNEERQSFISALDGYGIAQDIRGFASTEAYLCANAADIRDLLGPFDTRVKPKCEAMFARDENFLKAPGYADTREELELAYKRLRAIAEAIKPLRDWYHVSQDVPPDSATVFAPQYGHSVTYGDLRRLFDACPRPGALLDEHA